MRFAVTTPVADQLFTPNIAPTMALSDDGQTLVYTATRDGVRRLYQRPLDQLEAVPISGTEGARYPFLSPDGEWVGYELDGTLRKIALTGGPSAMVYGGAEGRASDASWGTNDMIVFGFVGTRRPIMQVASTGGAVEPVTILADGEIDH